MPSIKISKDWREFLRTYPEFRSAYEEEKNYSPVLLERMGFEFSVHTQRWEDAALSCVSGDISSNKRMSEVSNWEEEVYCLRQMGAPGLACLAGRSYQRALDSQRQGQSPTNKFQRYLRYPGYLPLFATREIKYRSGIKLKNEQNLQDLQK